MKKLYKERKYLIVAIAIVIMFAIYFMRLYFRKEIKNLEKIYENGINLINNEKNYKKATDQFFLYLKMRPNDIETKYSIGYCYFMLGDYNEAIDYFSEVLKYDKSHFLSMDYLAKSYIYSKKEELYKDAIELLKRSELTMKEDIYVWNKLKELFLETKAWVYYNTKEIEKALKTYNEVIPIYTKYFKEDLNELDECFAEVHYHFGIIHKHNRDFSNAKIEFEKAIKAGGPQNIFAKRSKTELKYMK